MYKTKLPLVCQYMEQEKFHNIEGSQHIWDQTPDIKGEDVTLRPVDATIAIHFAVVNDPDVYSDVLMAVDASNQKTLLMKVLEMSIKSISTYKIDAGIKIIPEFYLRCKSIFFYSLLSLRLTGKHELAHQLYDLYQKYTLQPFLLTKQDIPQPYRSQIRAALIEYLDNHDLFEDYSQFYVNLYQTFGTENIIPSLEGEAAIYFLDYDGEVKDVCREIILIVNSVSYFDGRDNLTQNIRDKMMATALDYEMDTQYMKIIKGDQCIIL